VNGVKAFVGAKGKTQIMKKSVQATHMKTESLWSAPGIASLADESGRILPKMRFKASETSQSSALLPREPLKFDNAYEPDGSTSMLLYGADQSGTF